MNESGRSAGPARGAYKLDLDRILVLHDEIDLPFGEIRSRTPSCRTSAAVPGVEPRPAALRRSKTARGSSPETSHMYATSMGEYACRWMCGAASHPGGGVHGLCGRNAARALLRVSRFGV